MSERCDGRQVMLETPNGSLPLKYTVEEIPEQPDAQVAATINRMCQYVCADWQSAPIQYDLQSALAIDPNNPLCSIHSFVRSRMRFKRDEELTEPFQWMLKKPGDGPGQDYFVECLKRPVDVSLEYAATGVPVEGDCDDFAMYCAALMRACGIDCCFAVVGANSKNPYVYSHVYTVAYWGGARVPMDCSHGPYAGWQTDRQYRYAEFPIFDRAAWSGVGVGICLAAFALWKYRRELGEMFA